VYDQISPGEELQTHIQTDGNDICSEMLQCSNCLSNTVSNIIRRLMDNMKMLLICILRVLLSQ
jgi:hypothetical protein